MGKWIRARPDLVGIRKKAEQISWDLSEFENKGYIGQIKWIIDLRDLRHSLILIYRVLIEFLSSCYRVLRTRRDENTKDHRDMDTGYT